MTWPLDGGIGYTSSSSSSFLSMSKREITSTEWRRQSESSIAVERKEDDDDDDERRRSQRVLGATSTRTQVLSLGEADDALFRQTRKTFLPRLQAPSLRRERSGAPSPRSEVRSDSSIQQARSSPSFRSLRLEEDYNHRIAAAIEGDIEYWIFIGTPQEHESYASAMLHTM